MPTAKIHLIAAARPNFMKVAPLYHALEKEPDVFDVHIVHTGQHYDANMSDSFFADLGMPEPHFHLGVGSGTHAEQTGRTMIEYEKICIAEQPDWVVVVGDVNATAAVALVCTKLHVPIAHLEAGLRSRDRTMPEEINRLVTDAVADLLWTPSPDGDENLLAEGVPAERIERVGNIMIDSFEMMRERIEAAGTRERFGLSDQRYGIVTMHRPANVDDPAILELLVDQLCAVADSIELVFPVHPRTRKRLEDTGLIGKIGNAAGITMTEPMGYIEFMNLVTGAFVAITDSGGLQEETTYLDIPCITLRPNTERPVTITEGTNKLVQPADLQAQVAKVLAGDWPSGRKPDLWDGATAGRCVASLKQHLGLT
ncbi:MAG: UDP-N-acetylglucosamine 2-epimerase (non-hydrolyzing) [Gammaproteobacteria bacterium]|nr:UDP-N-acetylglucosamine 2-epimerase (non-hydrolyzing) [Gammaproteobacteria bacterium]